MLRHTAGRSSQSPHPATYILFPPPATPAHDELFTTDLEGSCPRTLNYKKSCPALLGTASRRLERIHENRHSEAHEYASCDDTSPESVRSFNSESDGRRQDIPLLSKKRSFLLVDVIENLEGRGQPSKRQNMHGPGSVLPTNSLNIRGAQERNVGLRRQWSDFDLLYASSKGANEPPEPFRRMDRWDRSGNAGGEQEPLFDNVSDRPLAARELPEPRRGRQAGLRNQKSMIALSIERNRSNSPSKHRLSQINTHQITSFDALLDNKNSLKASPTVEPVDVSSPVVHFAQSSAFAALPPSPQVTRPIPRNFSHNTALLRQLPKDRPIAPRARQLRHAKSAKDILQNYSVNRPTLKVNHGTVKSVAAGSGAGTGHVMDVDQSSPPMKPETRAAKRAAKQASLRNDLRSMLGMKKKKCE